MRKPIQERVRKVRKQLEHQRQTATGPEAEQVAVLADYALGVQTAINLEGKQPFDYAGIAAYDAAPGYPKEFGGGREKGAAVSQACEQKLKRLQKIVEVCHRWDSSIEQVKRMRAWVLAAEHILDGSWAQREEEVTNQQVGQRFDSWYGHLQALAETGMLNDDEQQCLAHFLQVLAHLRPHLIHCYDVAQFPRTNNEMEGCIRAIKTRYRRGSSRKHWDGYLLRYGRRVAYYEWWAQEAQRQQKLDHKLRQVDRDCWRLMRKEISCG